MSEVTTEFNIREQHLAATKADGRQLVSIRKIDDLIPIPGADRIVTAMVGGWPVVVKNGEFQPGEMGLFFEPDSFLNAEDERFAFLASNKTEWKGIEGIRLKTIRLRKQLSQGLLLPLSLFPEIAAPSDDGKAWHVTLPDNAEEYGVLVGVEAYLPRFADVQSDEYQFISMMNFTTALGVIKWEKTEKASGGANLAGKSSGNFPPFLRKSDQTRCQNMGQEIFGYEPRESIMDPEMFKQMPQEAVDALISDGRARIEDGNLVRMYPPTASRDERFEVTLKLDGSSMTCYALTVRDVDGVDRRKFGVCSRNLELKADLLDVIVEHPAPDLAPAAMPKYENEGNAFVDTFHAKVRPIMELVPGNYALQGELCGPGIQGDYEMVGQRHGEFRFYVYNVFDIDQERNLKPIERHDFIRQLNDAARDALLGLRIEHVPVEAIGVTLEDLGITNMPELLAYAIGPGMYCTVREGFVFKSMERDEFQWKVISNDYLEKQG